MPASASARTISSVLPGLGFGWCSAISRYVLEAKLVDMSGASPPPFIIHCWPDVSGIGLGPINTSGDALNPMATRDRLDIVSRMPPRLSRAWILGRLSEGDDSRANTAGPRSISLVSNVKTTVGQALTSNLRSGLLEGVARRVLTRWWSQLSLDLTLWPPSINTTQHGKACSTRRGINIHPILGHTVKGRDALCSRKGGRTAGQTNLEGIEASRLLSASDLTCNVAPFL